MKKLEHIPKKDIFTVPEGYFDKLPSQIQSKIVDGKKSEHNFSFAVMLKYAVPATLLLLLLAGVLIYNANNSEKENTESVLATLHTEDLIAYLNDSDLSTDDVMEAVQFNQVDLEDIEERIYELESDDELFEQFLDEFH